MSNLSSDDPGCVLNVATKDLNGHRLVLREHEFGMSRSVLEYRPDEKRWRTISHTVRLFVRENPDGRPQP